MKHGKYVACGKIVPIVRYHWYDTDGTDHPPWNTINVQRLLSV